MMEGKRKIIIGSNNYFPLTFHHYFYILFRLSRMKVGINSLFF
jgi:hypothetical protein